MAAMSIFVLQPFGGARPSSSSTSLPLAGVSGPQKTLVILVDFSDKGNSTTPTHILTNLVGLNDYYKEDSYGLVSFQTDLTPAARAWFTMPQPMTSYGANTASSDSQLIHDALQAAYNDGANMGNYKFSIIVHAGNDQAMPPHSTSDIHSFTIPGYIFQPSLLTSFKISSSVVSESDPVGVFSHEAGHLLGLPDLYDVTQRIDPTNNFMGYWEIMALGEWNPNTGNPLGPQPGTYPSHHSVWSKIQLGFISSSNIANVSSGESKNITIQNLETQTSGIQAVKIPIAFNQDGTSTYYLMEMRAKIGTYDQYLPFATGYPGAGLLIYKVNESIPAGTGSIRLIDAHPGSDLSSAPFGPCISPCVSNNTFWDQANFVKVIVTATTPTAYSVVIDRTSSPEVLLQVNSPSVGVLVSVDRVNSTTDSSKEVRVPVRFGPHTIYIQPQIPISIGSTTLSVGLTNSFSSWDDGATSNPLGLTVTKDTIVTAIYRISAEPSAALALTAVIIISVIAAGLALHRRKPHHAAAITQPGALPAAGPPLGPSPVVASFPRNHSLLGQAYGG